MADAVKFTAQRPKIGDLEFFGVEQRDVYDTIQALFGGTTIGYSHRGEDRNPIEIMVGLPKRNLSWSALIASTPVPANTLPGSKTVVELGDIVRVTRELGSPTIFPRYGRYGRFADMVMAELAGAYEAPIYGILEVNAKVAAHDWGHRAFSIFFRSNGSQEKRKGFF